VTDPAEPAAPPPRSSRWTGLLATTSPVPVLTGVAVTAVGFALIALAWAKIAALTDVALQLPYLVSAGVTGLALVMVGLLIISIAVRRQDAAEHRRQLEALTEAVRDMQRPPGQ
jgi:hypothetical protein